MQALRERVAERRGVVIPLPIVDPGAEPIRESIPYGKDADGGAGLEDAGKLARGVEGVLMQVDESLVDLRGGCKMEEKRSATSEAWWGGGVGWRSGVEK